MDERAHDRGQVLPLVTLVVVFAGLVCLAAGKLGGAAVARAQAATAADAAALAGAAAGRPAALQVAAANGGRVRSYEQLGTDVRVEVDVGRASAGARARSSVAPAPGGVSSGGVAPAMRAALARAAQLVGRPVPLVASPRGIALPGDAGDRHAHGLAVDVAPSFAAQLALVATEAGLCQPYPESHPVHFELCAYRLP